MSETLKLSWTLLKDLNYLVIRQIERITFYCFPLRYQKVVANVSAGSRVGKTKK